MPNHRLRKANPSFRNPSLDKFLSKDDATTISSITKPISDDSSVFSVNSFMSKSKSVADATKAKSFLARRKQKLFNTLNQEPEPDPIENNDAISVNSNNDIAPRPFIAHVAAPRPVPFTRNLKRNEPQPTVIPSSSTISSLGAGSQSSSMSESKWIIRSAFQRGLAHMSYTSSSTDSACENSVCSGGDNSTITTGYRSGSTFGRRQQRNLTGRGRLLQAINKRDDDLQAVLGPPDDNSNKGNDSDEENKNDLRSLYQKFLDGKIEKVSLLRSGDAWTKRYRIKRYSAPHRAAAEAQNDSDDDHSDVQPFQEIVKGQRRTMNTRLAEQ